MIKFHFLNVGHGECTLIEHPSGRLTMVDINNSQEYDKESFEEFQKERRQRVAPATTLLGQILDESAAKDEAKRELTDPIAYMKTHYPDRTLFRFILTHPDMDHMRGIKRLHDEIGFVNFWDSRHTKSLTEFRSDDDKADWQFYTKLRGGQEVSVRTYHRGDAHFAFAREESGIAGGDNIEILSPTPALVASCNEAEKSNDLSYVLRVGHAGKTVMLTGDVEEEGWVNMGAVYGRDLKSDFLQASHHGRDSGHHDDTLKLIAPRSVIVSVGRKPPTDASRKYHAQCGHVMSTRYYGNIELHIADDGTHQWFVERNYDKA